MSIDGRRAAVGFCFGGGNVLELYRDGADIAAAVSIHGDLKTASAAKKGAVKAKLLVAHGAPDPVAPKAEPQTLSKARWMRLAPNGRCSSSLASITPIPMKVPMFPVLRAGISRHAGQHARRHISSSPMPSQPNCDGTHWAAIQRGVKPAVPVSFSIEAR